MGKTKMRHRYKGSSATALYGPAKAKPDDIHPSEGDEELAQTPKLCADCANDPDQCKYKRFEAHKGPKRTFAYWHPLGECGLCAKRPAIRTFDVTRELTRAQCLEVVAATQDARALQFETYAREMGDKETAAGETMRRVARSIRMEDFHHVRRANRPKALIKQLIAEFAAISQEHTLKGRECIDFVCSDGTLRLSCMAAHLAGTAVLASDLYDAKMTGNPLSLTPVIRAVEDLGIEIADDP